MANLTRLSTKKLGELLLESGAITHEQLETGLSEQKKSDEPLGSLLVELGYVGEKAIAKTLSTQFSLPYIEVSHYYISKEALKPFSKEFLRKQLCIPLDRIGNVTILAVSGPVDPEVLGEIEEKAGGEVALYVSTSSEIRKALDLQFPPDGAAPPEDSKPEAEQAEEPKQEG